MVDGSNTSLSFPPSMTRSRSAICAAMTTELVRRSSRQVGLVLAAHMLELGEGTRVVPEDVEVLWGEELAKLLIVFAVFDEIQETLFFRRSDCLSEQAVGSCRTMLVAFQEHGLKGASV